MSERITPDIEHILRLGGRLCLDFANTANREDHERVDERLNAYEDLTAWGFRCGLIDGGSRRKLDTAARKDLVGANRVLKNAIKLSDALWRVFSKRAENLSADLSLINWALARPAPRLKSVKDAFAVQPGKDLDAWLFHPLAASALELLTSPVRAHVKTCPGDRCSWVFVDESPSGRRRWCSMATCGNRHKAKDYYGRRKQLS